MLWFRLYILFSVSFFFCLFIRSRGCLFRPVCVCVFFLGLCFPVRSVSVVVSVVVVFCVIWKAFVCFIFE